MCICIVFHIADMTPVVCCCVCVCASPDLDGVQDLLNHIPEIREEFDILSKIGEGDTNIGVLAKVITSLSCTHNNLLTQTII